MAFGLFWTDTVKKDLNNLPREVVIRIIKKAEVAKGDPYRFLIKFIGRPEWKLRVGSYRVFCEVDYEKNELRLLHAGHRKKVYRKME